MALTTTTRSTHRLAVMQGILPWNRSGVPTDVIAGVTLAALAIPEVMGYTSIAGMPVITGLYTILVPVLLFACSGRPATSWSAPTRQRLRSWQQAWPASPRRSRIEYVALAGDGGADGGGPADRRPPRRPRRSSPTSCRERCSSAS